MASITRNVIWILVLPAIARSVEACSEKEDDFIGWFQKFQDIEQSDTFWEQLCNETGKTIIDGLQGTSDGCNYLWTDTVLGDVTIFRSLLRFQEYDGSYDIACEVETELACRVAWDCYTSVFDATDHYIHEGLVAFHNFYCGTVRSCLQTTQQHCTVMTEYLRKQVSIKFDDGEKLTFLEIENKLDLECAKIENVELDSCLAPVSDDGTICHVSPVVNQGEIQCNYTDQTLDCLAQKCGQDTATFYTNMFEFLRCGAEERTCSQDFYGDIVFDPARPGSTVSASCSFGQKGLLTRRCLPGGVWEEVNDNCEWDLNDLARAIDDLKNSDNISDEKVDQVLNDVKAVTKPVIVKKPPLEDIRNLASDVTLILGKKPVLQEKESSDFFDIISNTLDRSEDDWKGLIEKDEEGANTVIDNTDTIVRKLQTQDCNNLQINGAVKFTKTNLDVTIGKASSVISFSARDSSGVETGEINLSLDALENKGIGETCYGGVHYSRASTLVSPRRSVNGTIKPLVKTMFVNSDIISLQLAGQPRTNIDPAVTVTVKNHKPNQIGPLCVFWDFSLQGVSGNGAWSSEGSVLHDADGTKCVCKYSHLTNFAVLMSLRPQDEEHVLLLSFISAVGCFISMLGLFATVVCHGLVWRLVRSNRAVILMNFCCALFLALGVFLAGVNRTENKVACSVIAGVLHFLFLVVFFLMLLEGIEILLRVMNHFSDKFALVPLLLAAWMIPAVIVGISMVISLVVMKTDGYGYKEHCWLSTETGLIWAFVGPAAFVILINFIVIVSIFCKMAQTTMLKGRSAKQKITTSVRSLCVLLPLLGCCWVFGVLSVNSDLVVFQYIFCVVNSLQGLFVFVFHCVYNQQLRDALRRRREKKHSRSTLKSSFKSTSRKDSSANRKHSKSHNSISSEKNSVTNAPSDLPEIWETGQGQHHQRDLRHSISN